MKKSLLLAAAAMVVASAGAQPVSQKTASFERSQIVSMKETAVSPAREMKMASPAEMAAAKKAPKKAGYIESFYQRPAGMFHSPFIHSGGAGFYSYGNYQFLISKPFADYTFKGSSVGADENCTTWWQFWMRGDEYRSEIGDTEITYASYFSSDDAPYFWVIDGDPYNEDTPYWGYQMTNFEMEGDDANPVIKNQQAVQVLSLPNSEMYDDDMDFLLTSKTMTEGGRYGESTAFITSFYGAEPYGNNERGWWFGKNGEHIDGMAQAFEKPTRPYMLKNVYLQANTGMICNGNVKLTCKVYKLDEIPAYEESTGAGLPLEPGQLIVTGEATVTPTTAAEKNGLIEFTLYGFDEDDPELTYEYTPTIDYPILVCIDGYNDPEAADLVEFTAYIGEDWDVDEGYGELAYLKFPRYEVTEDNDTVFSGDYYWRGLNNFFSGPMTMKTGLTVFITVENPYLTFNHGMEDGEYTFPAEGGQLKKIFEYSDTTIVSDGIEFFTWTPSADGDWSVLYNGEDELPEWLNIDLEDGESYETGSMVYATVTADPLPEGVTYREAEIRFEIPGDFLYYKFMQGEKPEFSKYDVNHDGEVNIADVNYLIDMILNGNQDKVGDVNDDLEVNLADVNAVIDAIVSGVH